APEQIHGATVQIMARAGDGEVRSIEREARAEGAARVDRGRGDQITERHAVVLDEERGHSACEEDVADLGVRVSDHDEVFVESDARAPALPGNPDRKVKADRISEASAFIEFKVVRTSLYRPLGHADHQSGSRERHGCAKV